ncbi:MAG: MFS transporter [Pseudomonadota bacterium]
MIGRFLRDNARWLGAGMLLTFFSSFGQTFFISIYSEQIRSDFDLSHSAWGSLYAVATTISAIVMVWAGVLTDIFRVRVLGPLVLALLAVACFTMAIAPAAWMLFGVIFLLRFSGQGMMSHVAAVAMTRWFIKTRGKALSTAAVGFALGEAILPLSFVALMAVISWRLHWGISAVFCVIAIPVLLWLLREERTPQAIAKETQAVGMRHQHWTRGDAVKHPLFWLMIPTLLGPAAFVTAFFFQQVPLAMEKGWTHIQLVALFPLYTLISIGATIGSGILIDKVGTARMIPVYQLPMVAAFAVLGLADTILGAALGVALLAATVGANATVPTAFWAEFYGTRHIGGIKSMAAAIMVLGSAIGPGLTGFLLDKGLSLSNQMLGFAAHFLIACGLAGIGMYRNHRLLPLAT